MKRRTFLQTTGLALAGSALAQGQPPSEQSAGAARTKAILITSADSSLAQAIAAGLAGLYRVALTSATDVDSDHPFTKCDFSDPNTTAALVHGTDAIVHVAQPPRDASGPLEIDYRTRGTYNLLEAAIREGVAPVVYLSSLDVMAGCSGAYEVTEDWSPTPSDEPGSMSHYLGEFTCRQFARDENVRICVLRLGHVVRAARTAQQSTDALQLDQRDAVQAVSLALAALLPERSHLGPWSVFHIASDLRNSRFPATKAGQMLGYRPQFAG